MCSKVYKASVSVIHLGMRGDREVSYQAFKGYLLFAKSLQGERKLQMLSAARQAYEFYQSIKNRQDADTAIINLTEFREAA